MGLEWGEETVSKATNIRPRALLLRMREQSASRLDWKKRAPPMHQELNDMLSSRTTEAIDHLLADFRSHAP